MLAFDLKSNENWFPTILCETHSASIRKYINAYGLVKSSIFRAWL